MLAHQQRVILELKDLDKKIQGLDVFIARQLFPKVEPSERGRLFRQHKAMTLYSDVLK